MFDVNKIITALQTDPNAQRTALAGGGGVAAGFAASMLMGKSGRKMMGKAAKYGAVAAIGGLAYHAWQKSQQNKQGQAAAPATQASAQDAEFTPAPENSAFLPAPSDEAAVDQLGKALVRAMIAAAKADGKVDAEEKEAIFARLNAMDLSAEDKAFVFDELSAPFDINAVVAAADTPEHAAEITPRRWWRSRSTPPPSAPICKCWRRGWSSTPIWSTKSIRLQTPSLPRPAP
jgi:uncharacterized membrane protein YebE (DUF533 family)